jgi:PAS domain S-box-containing protein
MIEKRETQQLEVLVQVAQLVATLDLDEVLLQTIKLTTDAVNASKGSFFLLGEDGKTLQRFIAARDMEPAKKDEVSQSILEGGLAGWVLKNEQAAIINDTATDDRWLKLDDSLRVRSALCVPFFANGKVHGIMTLEHPDPNHFTPEDMKLGKAVANQASSALRNAQLFDRVQTQQSELSAVLNSISEGLVAVDHSWTVRLLNPAAEAMIGMTRDQVVGHRLDEVSSNPFFKQLISAILEQQPIADTKSFELHDDTARKDYIVNLAVLQQDKTDQVGYAIALYDVTSLKDLNRLKTHMIKMASHDLKSPLGLLLGYIDLIWTDVSAGTMPDPTYIEAIYKAITRMETLIASLLDAHRSEKDTLESKPIDPYELIHAVLEDMLPMAMQHKQTVLKNIQKNLHPVKGDFVQLREAMNNLVGNAIKYTPDGGTITLNVYIEEDRFYFSVKDTGYGIPDDQKDRIFQPYFRAQQASTAHIEGTGVGLSLVKEVVERHGGQAWFISEVGSGSTFGFWLPLLA